VAQVATAFQQARVVAVGQAGQKVLVRPGLQAQGQLVVAQAVPPMRARAGMVV
jgi:hypothetical protein